MAELIHRSNGYNNLGVPIGTILPHYDWDEPSIKALIDGINFAYCDGTVKAVKGVGNKTLPDMSYRYLVGFGTEGGGDVGTEAWATAVVGNAGHQINIAHTHTGPSHTHDVNIGSFTSGTESVGGTAVLEAGPINVALDLHTHSIDPPNTTSTSGGTGATGSALSATQSIQCRSIRVRWYIRLQ